MERIVQSVIADLIALCDTRLRIFRSIRAVVKQGVVDLVQYAELYRSRKVCRMKRVHISVHRNYNVRLVCCERGHGYCHAKACGSE